MVREKVMRDVTPPLFAGESGRGQGGANGPAEC